MRAIVTLTGWTCSGKSTLEKNLWAEFGYTPVISHTSRKPREGEIDGKSYHFVDEAFFENNRAHFVEFVKYGTSYYGIHKASINVPHADVGVIVAEPNGAKQVADYCSINNLVHVGIGLTVPMPDLVERLFTRYENDPKEMKRRLLVILSEEIHWPKTDTFYTKHLSTIYCKQTQDQIHAEIKKLVDEKLLLKKANP